jgi:hypothetical protein
LFLLKESGLPGKRATLELAQAVADEGSVIALPDEGNKIERWFSSDDKDVFWIMRENLRKKRLTRMDAGWVEKCKVRLGM